MKVANPDDWGLVVQVHLAPEGALSPLQNRRLCNKYLVIPAA